MLIADKLYGVNQHCHIPYGTLRGTDDQIRVIRKQINGATIAYPDEYNCEAIGFAKVYSDGTANVVIN